jgi:hypothetical protein
MSAYKHRNTWPVGAFVLAAALLAACRMKPQPAPVPTATTTVNTDSIEAARSRKDSILRAQDREEFLRDSIARAAIARAQIVRDSIARSNADRAAPTGRPTRPVPRHGQPARPTSAGGLSPRPAESIGTDASSLERMLRTLDTSDVRLESSQKLFVGRGSPVTLRIARRAALPPVLETGTGAGPKRVHADAKMLVGDSATACLGVPRGWAFDSVTPKCWTQSVSYGDWNTWQWTVTPDGAADSVTITAKITAVLPGRPPKEFFSGQLTVSVAVAPCPLYRPGCLQAWATEWENAVKALTGLLLAVAALWLARKKFTVSQGDAEPAHGAGGPPGADSESKASG